MLIRYIPRFDGRLNGIWILGLLRLDWVLIDVGALPVNAVGWSSILPEGFLVLFSYGDLFDFFLLRSDMRKFNAIFSPFLTVT